MSILVGCFPEIKELIASLNILRERENEIEGHGIAIE